MTLKEMKIKIFSLIEEYYPERADLAEDSDVLNKINGVINSIQLDLMKYRKLNASYEVEITKEDSKIINLKEYLCYFLKVLPWLHLQTFTKNIYKSFEDRGNFI